MGDLDEIHLLLQRLTGKEKSLGMMNTYKALPISYPGTIVMSGRDVVCLRAEQLQLICLAREGMTYLHHEVLPKVVKARVSEVDFSTNQVLVYDFAYIRGDIGKRMQVRVEPEEPVVALFYTTDETKTTLCEVMDISLDGIGVRLQGDIDPAVALPPGSAITMHFRLPIGSDPEVLSTIRSMPSSPPLEKDYRLFRLFTVPAPLMKYPSIWGKVSAAREVRSTGCVLRGIVANIHRSADRQQTRVGIRALPGGASRSIISKYIVQRQAEIIHDLRDKYDMVVWLTGNEKPQTGAAEGG